MRIVGYEQGTGYLCDRDFQLSGMDGVWDSISSGISSAAQSVSSAASPSLLDTLAPGAGAAVGAILGVGTQLWADSAAREAARKQANAAAAAALRQQGALVQQQAFEATQQAKTVSAVTYGAVGIGALVALGVVGYLIYRSRSK